MVVVARRVTQPPQFLTDRELVAESRCGSDRAFAELYRRYAARVCGFVAGFIGDSARAEDLTQEIFLSAVRRLRVTDEPVAFKAWVFEIARNASIDELRRQRRSPEVAIEPAALEQAHPRVVHAPALDAVLAGREQLKNLRGAFHGLSRRQHQLLVLREFEGRSYDEIGNRLGMSRPMVESGLFRARRKLNREYDELTSGRRCEFVKTVIADGDAGPPRRLGLRQRRQVAHHLTHCQSCRRAARTAGLEEGWLRPPGFAGKIAVILPLPWLRWRAGRASGSSASVADQLTRWGSLTDPGGPLHGLASVAAAAAAVLVAGVGGGLIGRHGTPASRDVVRPAAAHVASTALTLVRPAAARPGAGSTSMSPTRRHAARHDATPRPGAVLRAAPAGSAPLHAPSSAGHRASSVAGTAGTSGAPASAANPGVPDLAGVTQAGTAGGALAAIGAALGTGGSTTGQLTNAAQSGTDSVAGAVSARGAVTVTAGTAVAGAQAIGVAASRAVRATAPVAH